MRVEGAISNRAEILRHELNGGVGPESNLLWRGIEQVNRRQIFRVVNHVSNRRLAAALPPLSPDDLSSKMWTALLVVCLGLEEAVFKLQWT